MNLQWANFEDLLATYYHGTAAHEAASHLAALISRKREGELATLLRDYREKAITSPTEINLRAAIDRLMNCCSVIEIASLTSFVPELSQTSFAREMQPILDDRNVRRYYQEFYPTKLPQLFCYRLAGSNCSIEAAEQGVSFRNVMAFLDLDRRFSEKLDDGYLLRMLDSFRIQGYWFSDVVDIIGSPQGFINRLMLPPEERDARSQALTEFSLFMQFCFDFRLLLNWTESEPLLQSAMWNHYSYWFDIIGDKLRQQLGDALARFLEWTPAGTDQETAKAIQTYVREAEGVLRVLTSRQFAGPVDALLRSLS